MLHRLFPRSVKLLSSVSAFPSSVVAKIFARNVWTVRSGEGDVCLKHDEQEHEIKFPYVWLRDNCRCPKCFHPPSNSRTIHIQQFNFDAVPRTAEVLDNRLLIEWTDRHSSDYPLNWLVERQFTDAGQKSWTESYGKERHIPWTAKDFNSILKRFQYNKLVDSDDALLEWLESLAISGIAVVEGARPVEGEIKKLVDRVGFLKKTQYGDVFRVEAKPDTTNVAYLDAPLQLHTDLPYYEYKPGVNLLHCVVQSEEGGENQLADCLAVAKGIKSAHPSAYAVLKETPVVWSDRCVEDGRRYHSVHVAPVICEDRDGRVERVNFSQPQRDSQFNVPLEKVRPWYNALRMFVQKLYGPEYCVEYKMRPGEILTFDNLRLVHGRLKYKGERFLEGGYLDWDHVYSRIRVIRSKYL